jgi:hypothetical protein
MGSSTAAGTQIAISAGAPTTEDPTGYAAKTYTNIGRVENIGAFGATVGVTEFEPLDGPKEKHKAGVDYGTLTPRLAHDDEDAGQSLLRTAAEVDNNDLYSYRITFPTGAKRYFQGRVFGYPEDVGNRASIIYANPSIGIETKIVKVAAPPKT